MATGDDALAAGMQIVDGATTLASDIDTEINRSRDYIAQGAGATDAATPNKVMKRDAAGRAKVANPSAAGDIANKQYVDNKVGTLGSAASQDVSAFVSNRAQGRNGIGLDWANNRVQMYVDATNLGEIANVGDLNSRVSKSGDTITGQLYIPNMFAVSSSYVAMWRNGDGRLGISASTRRAKRDIEPITGGQLSEIIRAVLQLQLVEFYYTDAIIEQGRPLLEDGTPDPDWVPPAAEQQIGLIAEELVEAGLDWLVFFDDAGQPLGIHYERLVLALLPAVQQLDARLTALETGA